MKTIILIIVITNSINILIKPQNQLHNQYDSIGKWVSQTSNTSENLNSVYFTDSLYGWVCGNNGIILHSSNGGQMWSYQNSNVSVNLNCVFFWDENNGWVVGDSGTVIHTSDKGEHWTTQNTPVKNNLHTIQFISQSDGFVQGTQTILRTTDSGINWVYEPGGGNSFIFLDEYRSAICEDYSIVYTIDGGVVWWAAYIPLIPNDMCGYRDTISYPTAPRDYYWIVGQNGRTDWVIVFEGIPQIPDWYEGISPDSICLKSITIENKKFLKLWSVGNNGSIIFSVDSGKTWESSSNEITANLSDIIFPSNDQGWVVGDSGTIAHYTEQLNSVIDEKKDKIYQIESFKFLHPFPNPFNNSTVIKYKLSKSGLVNLKLFNITGQLIVNLVEQNQEIGEYQIYWDGKNVKGDKVTSGIFIIRLEVNGIQQTDKIVLVK